MECNNANYIPSLHHFGGYVNITRGQLYYYHVPQFKNKTIIWTNGGPGCSSLEGMLLENGPYTMENLNGHYNLKPNPNSWSKYANMVYVDQPMNTGFSIGKTYATDQTQIGVDMAEFIQQLFKLHPLLKHTDLYLAGESFAGQYIPYIARACLISNITIKGMIIGNGWIDPISQYRAYVDFAIHHNLVDTASLAVAEQQYKHCEIQLKETEYIKVDICEDITKSIFNFSKDTHNGKCLNMYDIRLHEDGCGVNWPHTLPQLYQYLQNKTTVNLLHANPEKPWIECQSHTVGDSLSNDVSKPSFYLLPDLVKTVELYLYSGDQDFICNHMGTEAFLKRMKWQGTTGFKRDPTPLYFENEIMGIVQNERNVVYLKIADASHMVPFDQPVKSLHMIESILDGTFLQGTSHLMSNNNMGDHVHLHSNTRPSLSGVVALLIVTIGIVLFVGMKMKMKKEQQYELQPDVEMVEVAKNDKEVLYEYEDPDDV